jgi:hypothetical protein
VETGADNGVDDEVALGDLAEVQFPFLRRGDLDDRETEAAEDLQIRARVATHLGDAAEQEDGRLDGALRQRARDDEPVTAVVAPPAQHGDLARGKILERRFHRGDGLAPRVLHEHDGRKADLVDRQAIGFAHLLSVENAHSQLTVHGSQFTGVHGASYARGIDWLICVDAVTSTGTSPRPTQACRAGVRPPGFVYGEGVTRRCARTTACRSSTRHMRACASAERCSDVRSTTRCRMDRETVEAAGAREAYIRVLLTRGVGDLNYDLRTTPKPSTVIIVKPFERRPPRVR